MKKGRFTGSLLVLFAVAGGGTGCSLTTTRPIQEMYNADVALRAAKDLNADSLVPELYRGASDAYFNAKKEYRLKNFNAAKKFALRATRFAEQAEFEAYRMGGATPETSTGLTSPEGAVSDPDSAFREISPTDGGGSKYGKEPEVPAEKPKEDKPSGTLGPQGQTGPSGATGAKKKDPYLNYLDNPKKPDDPNIKPMENEPIAPMNNPRDEKGSAFAPVYDEGKDAMPTYEPAPIPTMESLPLNQTADIATEPVEKSEAEPKKKKGKNQ